MRDVAVEVPGGTVNVWHRPGSNGADSVALVHGLTGTSRWWAKVIDHLPTELGLIAIDVRGRGGSFDAPPPFDLATYAEDIVRCLDHFGVKKAIVAGYSMGGWVVGVFADRHPDRVERLILVDGGLGLPRNPSLDPNEVIEAIVGPSLARLNVVFDDEEAFYDYWKAHPALERHWHDAMRPAFRYELRETGSGYSVVANPDAIKESARQITVDPDTRNICAAVAVPCHFIAVERGTADEDGGMTPLATAEKASEANPNLTMEYLAGLNHYTVMLGDGAKTVAAAIIGD